MAMRFLPGKKKHVNLIIKDHVIRYAELKSQRDLDLARWDERFLPPGIIKDGKILDYVTLALILEECVNEWKIKNRQVYFTVPDPFIVLRKLTIPGDVQEDEIKGYLYMELGTSIHLPFEEPVFDYHVLSSNQKGSSEILLFAAPEEIVMEYTELFEDAKLRPAAADISSLALYRLYCSYFEEQQSEAIMLIQIDLNSAVCSIFESETPVFMRNIAIETDLTKWVTAAMPNGEKKLEYSGKEKEVLHPLLDIYNDIEKVMNFYRYSLNQGQRQISRIIVTGDHPWLERIQSDIKNRMEVPVASFQDCLNSGQYELLKQSAFHVNIGLGLKEG
ncbi:type IV pilus biogenesis protein PilM [Cytobacillus firmus]|uniref:type IV pilus biogenesis protein PilM n=1 Tax=Cytobacillus firmus TaxID=1399 RepID=UPI003002FE3C